MRKYRLSFVLLVVVLFVLGCNVFASNEGDFKFDPATGIITGYTGAGGDVVIPCKIDGVDVVSIGKGAFRNCTTLTSIIIPKSITSIGKSNFKVDLTNLGSNLFPCPPSIYDIKDNPFTGCIKLENITVEEGNLNYVSLNGILYNKDLTTLIACPSNLCSISIPKSVTTISCEAFVGCNRLTDLLLPDSISSIEYSAFQDCSSLTYMVIPQNVTNIGHDIFNGCINLEKVRILNSNAFIDYRAFSDCKKLTIYCTNNSYAESFAHKNNIPFISTLENIENLVTIISKNSILIGNNVISLNALSENYPKLQEIIDNSAGNIYYNLDGVTDGFNNLFTNIPMTELEKNSIKSITFIDFVDGKFTIQKLDGFKEIAIIDEEYNGKTIVVNKEQLIKLKLEENGSTGFGWSYFKKADVGILEEIHNKSSVPLASKHLTGSGGVRTIIYKPIKNNTTCEIILYYCQPWDSTNIAKQFYVKVIIETDGSK